MPSYRNRRLQRIIDAQNNLCYYCEQRMCRRSVDLHPTIEHLQRRADGGRDDDPTNVVAACSLCNSHRGKMSPHLWKLVSRDIIPLRQARAKAVADIAPTRLGEAVRRHINNPYLPRRTIDSLKPLYAATAFRIMSDYLIDNCRCAEAVIIERAQQLLTLTTESRTMSALVGEK